MQSATAAGFRPAHSDKPRAIWAAGSIMRRQLVHLALLLMVTLSIAAPASARLQCAPYARSVSGIALFGRADGWWQEADGRYARGNTPKVGAILAFRATHSMPAGHVAMVGEVIDARHVTLNHANWSRPGMIEREALAEDVSADGDWSQVRVWYAPSNGLGLRPNPTYGFIYGDAPSAAEPQRQLASAGGVVAGAF